MLYLVLLYLKVYHNVYSIVVAYYSPGILNYSNKAIMQPCMGYGCCLNFFIKLQLSKYSLGQTQIYNDIPAKNNVFCISKEFYVITMLEVKTIAVKA